MLSKEAVFEAVKAAKESPFEVPARGFGCGRAYVSVGGERAEVNAVSAACKKLGLMFLRKAYGTLGNAIYVGYDNADGRALARAEAMATVLKARGLRAYVDAVQD